MEIHMWIYFGWLLALFLYHGRDLWQKKDRNTLLALVTVALLSALSGAVYYRMNP